MLTRLRVQNFKNLRDVEVYFGPLTVIAGPNGVGKSNLLDAIQFLSNTATMPLTAAALEVRKVDGATNDIRKFFYSMPGMKPENIRFEADLILPVSAKDHLGQIAIPATLKVRYSLEVGLSEDPLSSSPFELIAESLSPIEDPRMPLFIRTSEPGKTLELFNEVLDMPLALVAQWEGHAPSVVSRATANAYPTATCTQQELKSWSKFALQPDLLARQSQVAGPHHLSREGNYLAATILQIALRENSPVQGNKTDKNNSLYRRIITRLRGLVPDLASLWIELNDAKTSAELIVEDKWGNVFHPASLSEGTLRLIALATLLEDESATSLLAIEEPENGFHPHQLPLLVRLLSQFAIAESNTQRQVIATTHSPSLVAVCPEDSVLFAASEPQAWNRRNPPTLQLSCLAETWRAKIDGQRIAPLGELIRFLGVVPNPSGMTKDDMDELRAPETRAVFQREELQPQWLTSLR